MPTNLVGASRDGDQFHYYWAARRCLSLLNPRADLRSVTVEGAPSSDSTSDSADLVIDVAELYGGHDIASARLVVFAQLKHSTVQIDSEWSASGFKRTLEGFGDKYKVLLEQEPGLVEKVWFDFVTNRPVKQTVKAEFDALARGAQPKNKRTRDLLKRYAGLDDEEFSHFCSRFRIAERAPSLAPLAEQYRSELRVLVPGDLADASLRLKELVTERATSAGASLGPIVRADVLTAMEVDAEDLFPAPEMIERPDILIVRDDWRSLADTIVDSQSPIIVHAPGGLGKSVFAVALESLLPPGSTHLVYDCFGAGQYRLLSKSRHQHRQALTQIVNEMASVGLCEPLIPTMADNRSYMRLFVRRVEQASAVLEAQSTDAVLSIVIDAADNSVMAARQFGDGDGFVPDLIREPLPSNVRLVFLSRPERIERYLAPPASVNQEPMPRLSIQETLAHMRTVFENVRADQAAEFHEQTFGNPRVQISLMKGYSSVPLMLDALVRDPLDEASALDSILSRNLAEVRDAHGDDAGSIDQICEALATLRPRVPLSTIAAIYSIDPSFVESFASDLGRPLLLQGGTLQFRDEPTETFFRQHFRASGQSMQDFLNKVEPLADSDAYLSAVLPQLLWESDRIDALLDLAMSDRGLPHGDNVERAEVESQRLQFALKALMRAGRLGDVVQLALKAGERGAGNQRRTDLIRSNTDLAGRSLDAQVIEGILRDRSLKDDRPGAHQPYEASLLAELPASIDLARNRLRSAQEWILGWVRRPDSHSGERVTDDDITQIAIATLRTRGPEFCVEYLNRWTPPAIAFRVGLALCRRALDGNREQDLLELIEQAEVQGSKLLLLAACRVADEAGVSLPAPQARKAVTMLKRQRKALPVEAETKVAGEHDVLAGVISIVKMGIRSGQLKTADVHRILDLYLPLHLSDHEGSDRPWRSTDTLLKAFALKAASNGVALEIEDVASPTMRKMLGGTQASHSTGDLYAFQRNIQPLVTWANAWVQSVAGVGTLGTDAFCDAAAKTFTFEVDDYQTPRVFLSGAIRFASEVLASDADETAIEIFRRWVVATEGFHSRRGLCDAIIQLARSEAASDLAYLLARMVQDSAEKSSDGADEKVRVLVQLARAVSRLDVREGNELFESALVAADRVGDEVQFRLHALLQIARQVPDDASNDPQRAYELARAVESIDPYLYDGIDYSVVTRTIAELSLTSAIAITSRWQDRNFGDYLACVSELVTSLRRADVAPLTCLLLEAFTLGRYLDNSIVEESIQSCDDLEKLEKVRRIVREVSRHGELRYSDSFARRSHELCVDLSVDPTTPALEPLRPDQIISNSVHSPESTFEQESRERSDAFVASLKASGLASIEDLGQALDAQRDAGWPTDSEQVWAEALSRPRGTWTSFLDSARALQGLHVSDISSLLAASLAVESPPIAFSTSLRKLALEAAERFADRIVTSARWEPLPIQLVADAADMTPSEVFAHALAAAGRSPERISAEQCFEIASTTASYLTAEEATDGFDLAIAQLAELVTSDTADGDWTTDIEPSSSVDEGVAAFIWMRLGDPIVAERWNASHAVVAACLIGETPLLDALARLIDSEQPAKAFFDRRFPFYTHAARHFAFQALAKAAVDTPRSVQNFEASLRRGSSRDERSVTVREDARTALRLLSQHGLVQISQAEDSEFDELARATADPMVLDSFDRRKVAVDTEVSLRPAGKRFHLPMDFDSHWVHPLADAFGISHADTERYVADIVQGEWGHTDDRGWRNDPRHAAGAYPSDPQSDYRSYRHRIEGLDYYRAMYATHWVAGDLLHTHRAYRDPDREVDDLTRWLRSASTTRANGRWLSDRADEVPADQHNLSSSTHEEVNWQWMIKPADFDALLCPSPGIITVWSSTEESLYNDSLRCSVRSALVSPARSSSLTRALQHARSSNDFIIPSLQSHGSLSFGSYVLQGWIEEMDYEQSGCDEMDPIAAGIRYPLPRPGREHLTQLAIAPDLDDRNWLGEDGEVHMVSTVWNDQERVGHDREDGSAGHRLALSATHLSALLKQLKSHLVVEVQIDRNRRDNYRRARGRDDDDTIEWFENSFRIYRFDGSNWFTG